MGSILYYCLLCPENIVAISFRGTRFYGFSLAKPFVHTSGLSSPVTDDDTDLVITKQNLETFRNESEYLPCGKYLYISNDTFFPKFQNIEAASSVSEAIPVVQIVENSLVIPESVFSRYKASELKTMTMLLRVTKTEYERIMGSSSSMTTICTQDISPRYPELAATQNLLGYIPHEYGEDFSVMCNQQLLTKFQPLCQYSTSKPDLCIFHTTKYVFRNTVVGSVGSNADVDPEDDHLLSGVTGEDKPKSSVGENQVVAAMLLLATKLGVLAVAHRNYFNKAIPLCLATPEIWQ